MKRSDIQKIVLGVIGVAGILTVAAIAPNVLQVLGRLPGTRRYFPSYVRTRVERLCDQGLIQFSNIKGNRVIRLTQKGKRELERCRLLEKTKTHLQWDGYWRMIIFDIHEYKRSIRHKIRTALKQFGFKQLQQSVWIYPYDCEDAVIFLKADHRIGKELLYITAKTIENDKWLKKGFDLV